MKEAIKGNKKVQNNNLKSYKDILKNMPQNLNELEKARWIYIKVGEQYSYNEKYITSQNKREKEIIKGKELEELENNEAVCTSLSKMYEELLKKIKIQAETINRGEHSYNIFKLNENEYLADLTRDLANIKVGFKTDSFLVKKYGKNLPFYYEELPEEQLKKIDNKIGYTYNGMYMDDIAIMLHSEIQIMENENSKYGTKLKEKLGIQNLKEKELLEYEVDFIANYMGHENLKCLEKSEIFQEFIKRCIDIKKYSKFFTFSNRINCINKDKTLRSFYVITDKEDNSKIIYNIEAGKKISKISQLEIKELFDNGMRVLSKKKREWNSCQDKENEMEK